MSSVAVTQPNVAVSWDTISICRLSLSDMQACSLQRLSVWEHAPHRTAPMHEFPHHYTVSARALSEGGIELKSSGLEAIISLPPIEFDGPGDHWSPETLFTAALADCFILTFRALARSSKFSWEAIECEVEGLLERVERVTRFTEFHTRVTLTVPAGISHELGQRLLEKAKHGCLISNSISAKNHLESQVLVAPTHPSGG